MRQRLRLMLAGILTIFVVFTGRLMYLQFAMAEEFKTRSTANYMEQRRIEPLRGRILARDGTVLAGNRIAMDLMYWGGEIEHWDRLRHLLELEAFPDEPSMSDAQERLHGEVVSWNVPDALVPAVQELVAGQPNLYLRKRIERTYPTNLAAHVVGYTTEADPLRFPEYELGDMVGLMGVEKSYQEVLFGVPGWELATVNNRGVVLETKELQPAVPGQDVKLTIDPKLQLAARNALEHALKYVNDYRLEHEMEPIETVRGAFVAMDPRTGEILAMASLPTFDQNLFTHRPTPPGITGVLSDPDLPLMNRAVKAFPPASTFKLVTSSALLENGYITPQTEYFCSAYIVYGGIRWDNWSYPASRGVMTVKEAIGDSCNTFYWLAAIDTPEFSSGWSLFAGDLTERARQFGFGQQVGVALPEEEAGRVPVEGDARQYFGTPWYPGYTLNMSIGQAPVLATPLQVALLGMTVAMEGRQAQPHLIKAVDGEPVEVEVREVPGRYWDVLKRGMELMISEFSGGGYSPLGPTNFPVAVAAKSGTAENAGIDHTWIVSYGPVDEPEVVIAAFIEHGVNSTAAMIPLARDFYAAYFDVGAEILATETP